jgi:hypothetical protein
MIDSFYVAECDDEGGERYYECSERSWQREFVRHHLIHSDKHRKTEDEADDILDKVEPEMMVESEHSCCSKLAGYKGKKAKSKNVGKGSQNDHAKFGVWFLLEVWDAAMGKAWRRNAAYYTALVGFAIL